MNLALIISFLTSGGAERASSELANHWVSENHQVTIITFASPDSKPFYHLDRNINLIQLDQGSTKTFLIIRLANILKRLFCLRKTLKTLKPNIVISFMDTTNMTTLLASLGLKTPVIVSERTDPNHHYLPSFYQKLRVFIYKKAAAVTVQTKAAADFFKNLKNICIIPNAISKPDVAKQMNSSSIQHIVSVGRLCPFKNFDTLIRAFANLIKHYPDLKLTIYGEGAERTNLENLIKKLNLQDKVYLPGAIENINEALVAADLFVFPSQYEGFPNALCEAMACGLPVIASNCSGNIDVVRDGIDGLLFPVGDITALTNIALALIKNPEQRQSLSENAKTICERFSTDRIYGLWDQIIEKCKIANIDK